MRRLTGDELTDALNNTGHTMADVDETENGILAIRLILSNGGRITIAAVTGPLTITEDKE